jgi:BTB/POZ domain-containing protein 9
VFFFSLLYDLKIFYISGKLYNQSEYSDIELIIESEHFYAHRIILAARSEYFRALLYGGLCESQHHTIEIKECKVDAFRILLLYIYTGRINLTKEKVILFV